MEVGVKGEGVERKRSLVDEGEEEGSGWGFVDDMGLGKVGGDAEGREGRSSCVS